MKDLIYTNGNGQQMYLNTAGSKALYMNYDPYNPLRLPDYTIRVKMMPGSTLTALEYWDIAKVNPVPGQADVYDVSTSGNRLGDWSRLFWLGGKIKEVLGANSTNVTNMTELFAGQQNMISDVALFDTSNVTAMEGMFSMCHSLTSVPLFNMSNISSTYLMFDACISLKSIPLLDTSNIVNMDSMCINCSSLSSIPLFNTTNVTSMNDMFYGCLNVQSGALNLYQQASTQANVPSHEYTFYDCGINTVQGAAELAQIPADWK